MNVIVFFKLLTQCIQVCVKHGWTSSLWCVPKRDTHFETLSSLKQRLDNWRLPSTGWLAHNPKSAACVTGWTVSEISSLGNKPHIALCPGQRVDRDKEERFLKGLPGLGTGIPGRDHMSLSGHFKTFWQNVIYLVICSLYTHMFDVCLHFIYLVACSLCGPCSLFGYMFSI